jgi:hypothetical protein
MLAVRTLRIRSSLLASAAAVGTVAAALAAGTGAAPTVAAKGDRLPMPVQISCEGPTCDGAAATPYRTTVEHDRDAGVTTLTRIEVED